MKEIKMRGDLENPTFSLSPLSPSPFTLLIQDLTAVFTLSLPVRTQRSLSRAP